MGWLLPVERQEMLIGCVNGALYTGIDLKTSGGQAPVCADMVPLNETNLKRRSTSLII